jgi:hypothetical protein
MAAEEGGAPARQFSPVGPGPLGRGPWRVGGVEAVGAGGCRSDRRGRRRIDDEHGSLADVIKEWEMSETEGLAVLDRPDLQSDTWRPVYLRPLASAMDEEPELSTAATGYSVPRRAYDWACAGPRRAARVEPVRCATGRAWVDRVVWSSGRGSCRRRDAVMNAAAPHQHREQAVASFLLQSTPTMTLLPASPR